MCYTDRGCDSRTARGAGVFGIGVGGEKAGLVGVVEGGRPGTLMEIPMLAGVKWR